MKKTLLTIIFSLFAASLIGISALAYNNSYESSMDKVYYYFDNGYYCEAMDELSWIDYYSCSDDQKSLLTVIKPLCRTL